MNYPKARKELEKIIDPSTLVLTMHQEESVRHARLSATKWITRISLKMPDRNRQEIIALWTAFLEGAKALQSTIALDGARSLYDEMTTAFPGDKDIEELRSQLPPRGKKAPDA